MILKKFKEILTYHGGHYEVSLPWKEDHLALKDNYQQAKRRLHNLEKKLLYEPSLRSWRYCKRPRNKVLAAEPTIERRSHEENGKRDSEIPFHYFRVPLPILLAASPLACRLHHQNFISRALTIPPATQATMSQGKLHRIEKRLTSMSRMTLLNKYLLMKLHRQMGKNNCV